jgi:hypothetical protein
MMSRRPTPEIVKDTSAGAMAVKEWQRQHSFEGLQSSSDRVAAAYHSFTVAVQ